MKIYEIYSWPLINNIPGKLKRYFFSNKDAANQFVKYLDKVESDYKHNIYESDLNCALTLNDELCEEIIKGEI